MNDFDEKINEIRGRVVEQEEKELFARAERLWPGDKKRQEEWVYRKLSAKYDFRRGEQKKITNNECRILNDELDEILNLPLNDCEVSIGFRASGFRKGDCLADILKRGNA